MATFLLRLSVLVSYDGLAIIGPGQNVTFLLGDGFLAAETVHKVRDLAVRAPF